MAIKEILGADIGRDAFKIKVNQNFASHEERINTLEEGINAPTYTAEVTKQEPIFSVEAGAITGQVSPKIKGLSAVNLVKNGNFANGAAGWVLNSSAYIIDGALNISDGGATAKCNIVANNNDLLYLSFRSKGTSLQAISWQETPAHTIATSTVYTKYSVLKTYLSSAPKYFQLFSSGGGVYFDDVMLINLTAIDLAIKTALECDKMFPKYFDGIGSVNNIKVVSRGKNLVYNGNCEHSVGGWTVSAGCSLEIENSKFKVTTSGTAKAVYQTRRVKPNTNYYISESITAGTATGYVQITDSETGVGLKSGTGMFNTGNSTSIDIALYMTSLGYIYHYNISLEEGTVSTPYKPYQESISYVPKLCRLPNGVYDEIIEGKLTKRIGEGEIKSSNILSMVTTYSNLDYALYTKPSDYLYANSAMQNNISVNSIVINGFNTTYDTVYDDVLKIGLANTNYSLGSIAIGFAKGTTLAQAQTALAGTKILYQLATPIVTDGVSTPLTIFENGTISIESDEETVIPEITMSYPVDICAVIARLNDGVNQNAKNINTKAEKEQEDWITATLKSGWIHNPYQNLLYFKDSLNCVHVWGGLIGGTAADGTVVAVLPVGYRPSNNILSRLYKFDDSQIARVDVKFNGDIVLYGLNATGTIYMDFEFRATK